jgi:hypothetical protein
MTPDTEIEPELLEQLLRNEGIEKTLRLYTDRYNAVTERHKADVEIWRGSFEAIISFAELAIKSLLLLCGGAAVALLSFAGSRSSTTQISLDAYATAVAYFGGAAAGAVLTAGLAYLAQVSFGEKVWAKIGERLRYAAIIAWLASLTGFAFGVWEAADAVMLSRWDKVEVHTEPQRKP